jgi:hypothetical protein
MATNEVIIERDTKSVTVSRSDTRTGKATVTADPTYTVVETTVDRLVEQPISREVSVEDRTYYKGDPGPQGIPGPTGPPGSGGSQFDPDGYYGISPNLSYTTGKLTRVDYLNGDYKLLSYTGSLLTQIDWVLSDKIIRKTLTYAGSQLDLVTQQELPL